MVTATITKTTSESRLQDMADMPGAGSLIFPEDFIHTEITYLVKDPKHENEKPYDIRYDTGGVIPNTNMASESRPVLIRNFRPLQTSESFEEYGFSSAKIDCPLTTREFENEKKVEVLYYPVIEKLLRQEFPDAGEIRMLEHVVRKRHPGFPAAKDAVVEFAQPATHIHIDFSVDSAATTALAAFKIARNQYRRLLTVNFWKLLQGPGNDWPLALCDHRTIDHSSESVAADVVFHNRYTENERLYYSPKHEWYYFKDLRNDEVIMMRQTDSDLEHCGGVAHSSFFNPKADENAAPRASIELRAFVFFI